MELLTMLSTIPVPVLIVVAIVLLFITLFVSYQYLEMKGLEGIRAEVYQLILKAEHLYEASGTGKQKLKWVVQQARGLLPSWLGWIITEDVLMEIVDKWFQGVKDLMDDGKVNGSSAKKEVDTHENPVN